MTMRYTIDVEMKRGYSPLTERHVETAVFDAAVTPSSIRSVSVKAGLVRDEVKVLDLFAYAQRKGDKWVLLDYFNTHKKAANAVKRAKVNTLTAFKKDGEFAVMMFNPNTSTWEIC